MKRRLSIAAAALLVGCDALGPSTDGDVPTARSYEVIGIDSVDVVLVGVGVSASGIVAGLIRPQFLPHLHGFRWKDGVLQRVAPTAPQTSVSIAGINESGDIVGNTDPNRPFIWRAADDAPTRLFPFDTAVTALGINARGEVLLYPRLEYSPGASVWYQGEIRRLPTAAPIRPRWLTDAGYIIGEARGEVTEALRFPASPFFPPAEGWSRSGRCPGTVRKADGSGRLLSVVEQMNNDQYFVDDVKRCHRAGAVFPGLIVSSFWGAELGFTADGLYWGIRDEPYSEDRDVIGRGGALVHVTSLPAAPLSQLGWKPRRIVAASGADLLLASGVKTSGYGVGKPGLMLLKRR